MELSTYGAEAIVWREAYLTAMHVGHADPAAAADEALVEFMSRFSQDDPFTGLQEAAAQGTTNRIYPEAEQQAIRSGRQFVTAGEQLTLRDPAPLGEGPSIEAGDAPADTESDDLG